MKARSTSVAAVDRAADCAGVRVVLTSANEAMNDGDCDTDIEVGSDIKR